MSKSTKPAKIGWMESVRRLDDSEPSRMLKLLYAILSFLPF
jgi:hypothetical protein